MPCEFPLPFLQTRFGPIPEPAVDLPLRLTDGYLGVRFFLDTGADVSMLPRDFAEPCGVDLTGAPSVTVTGIEGGGIRAWVGEITLRIGGEDVSVPCLFTERDDTPALLGRAGIFTRFNVSFDCRHRKIVLESVGP